MQRETEANAGLQEAPIRWLFIKNVDTEVIPARGVCAIDAVNDDGSISVKRPTRNGQTDVLFNSFVAVSPGEFGQGTQSFPIIAAYAVDPQTESDPANGEIWGPEMGSWYLQKALPGFRVVGTGSDGLVNVIPMSQQVVSFVKITSTVQEDGYYPAVEMLFDPVTLVWSEGDVVWWRDANEV